MRFEILGPDMSVVNVVETEANPIRIGKSASCELCLEGSNVSRVHAQLDKSGDVYKISDRISAGGTFVNGKKVEVGKPVVVEDGATLMFGDVQVRVSFASAVASLLEADGIDEMSFEDEDSPGGATLAMEMPSLEELSNGGLENLLNKQEEVSAPEPEKAPAPAVAAEAPAPAAPAAPSIPEAPVAAAAATVSKSAVSSAVSPALKSNDSPAASMNKPAAGGGFGGGFAAPTASGPVQRTIIRKKKRAVSFERRFLSARGKSNKCSLEVAMVWRDTVLSITQYKPDSKSEVSVGAGKDCTYHVDTNFNGGAKIHLARFVNNRWEILFNNAFDGFVLCGERKVPFKTASSAEFQIPSTNANLMPGSLACPVDGSVRAKFVFGEVSILIHYVDTVPFVLPALAGLKATDSAPLIASLILHFAIFSVILFATDRVNALMVDRIISSSRFAMVVEQPVEEDLDEEKPDEEEPPEEDPEESDEVSDVPDDPTPFAATTSSNNTPNNGQSMGRAAAEGAAQATGLLAQSNAMNSMLAAGLDVSNLDNLDWSSFDVNAAAASAGYGMGATGTGGGGAGLGGFGAGGFGPGGAGGRGGAIAVGGRNANLDIGRKGEAKPTLKMKNPEVTGSIDKRIIQKVVRQHTGELRACYERELAKTKGLNGRIVVVWIISAQGAVTSAVVKETSMRNKNVESCITSSIKFWRFPAPKGGGMAQVEYPFVFELGSN